MWRVTIEDLDHPENGKNQFEYPNLNLMEERSIDTIMGTWGQVVDMIPTGYQRACIRLWAKGTTYDDYTPGQLFQQFHSPRVEEETTESLD